MREGTGSSPFAATSWQLSAQHKGIRARLLWPLSLVYGALSALRRWLYARGVLPTQRLPVPVIVVGNVVVGGAGKTPTTIALVRHLLAQGWQPGVVSRGYGRLSDDLLEVRDDTPAEDAGDEPALIRRTTGVPVFVARQRAAAARALLAAHPTVDVLLCDDGLQHLALARDIAVVVFDDRGVGNGWQLPAGLLREPWPPGRNASRPDLLLHQSRDQHPASALTVPTGLPAFGAVRRLAEHAFNAEQHRTPLAQLRNQPVVAVAGIARPDVFFDMLQERGLQLAQTVPLADHAGADAYRAVLQNAQQAIVCTEKDAVKLFAAARDQGGTTPPIWAVPLALQVDPGFFTAIDALLHQVRESLAKRAHATD